MERSDSSQKGDIEQDDQRLFELVRRVIELLRQDRPGDPRSTLSSSPQLARLFEQAELLVHAGEEHLQKPVFAYQLFRPNDEMMTAREIAKTFSYAGWSTRGVGHVRLREKILGLLKAAEKKIHSRLSLGHRRLEHDAAESDSMLELHKSIGVGMNKFIDGLGLSSDIPDLCSLRGAAIAQFERLLDIFLRVGRGVNSEEPFAMLSLASFMKFVCGFHTAEEYSTSKEKPVRAYELFLFAHQSNLFTNSLIGTIRNSKAKLSAVYSSSISILNTHGGVDSALVEWQAQKLKY